jgi:hypothetical protein
MRGPELNKVVRDRIVPLLLITLVRLYMQVAVAWEVTDLFSVTTRRESICSSGPKSDEAGMCVGYHRRVMIEKIVQYV